MPYGTDLALRRQILQYLVSEDPYGTLEFIEFGPERGDLRQKRRAIRIEQFVDLVRHAIGAGSSSSPARG